MINYINNEIIKLSKNINFTVKDLAPSNENELFNSTSLVIWSGGSETTIYQDASINYMFRAIHDNIHLKTCLGFTVDHEIEMGRIQAALLASQCKSLLADLFYCEIALQAEYFKKHNKFVENQIEFTKNQLNLKDLK